MNRVVVNAMSWSRFAVSNLFIAPSLAGAVASFKVAGRCVEICLPPRPPRPLHAGVHWGNDQISCESWRTSSMRPTQFHVEQVDVFVDLQRKLSVPAKALDHVDTSLFSQRRRNQLDRISARAEALAEDALRQWISAVRWKSLNGRIGKSQWFGHRTGWSTYLLEQSSRRRFYAETIGIVVPGEVPISKRLWNAITTSLKIGESIPVWFDFMFDGENRLAVGDIRGAIMCFAIATEVVVRKLLVAAHVRTPANDEFVSQVNYLKISSIIDRWRKMGFHDVGWSRLLTTDRKKNIKRLFELRNGLMHRASQLAEHQQECLEIARVVREFIVYASHRLAGIR